MIREQRHGWPQNAVRLAPIGFMLRRSGAVVRAETPGQPPAGSSDALGAGVRGLGAMLLWALSLRQADGGTHVTHHALVTSIPPAERPTELPATPVTPWLRAAPVGDRRALADDLRATRPREPMPQRSVVMNPVVTNRTELIRSQRDHHSSGSQPPTVAPDVWHGNQPPRPTPHDREPSVSAGVPSIGVPLSAAERLVTRRIQTTYHLPIRGPGSIGRGALPPRSQSLLPLVVSPLAGYERPDTERVEQVANVVPGSAPASNAAVRPDSVHRTGPHAHRRSLAGELTSLVDTITRTVEERIQQQMKQPTVIPVVAPSPRPPTAEETFQLTQAEQRERAFRMGR